jgi:hypothetical protein
VQTPTVPCQLCNVILCLQLGELAVHTVLIPTCNHSNVSRCRCQAAGTEPTCPHRPGQQALDTFPQLLRACVACRFAVGCTILVAQSIAWIGTPLRLPCTSSDNFQMCTSRP